MTWEKCFCRWCNMPFENLHDKKEHEKCHTDPMPKKGIKLKETK